MAFWVDMGDLFTFLHGKSFQFLKAGKVWNAACDANMIIKSFGLPLLQMATLASNIKWNKKFCVYSVAVFGNLKTTLTLRLWEKQYDPSVTIMCGVLWRIVTLCVLSCPCNDCIARVDMIERHKQDKIWSPQTLLLFSLLSPFNCGYLSIMQCTTTINQPCVWVLLLCRIMTVFSLCWCWFNVSIRNFLQWLASDNETYHNDNDHHYPSYSQEMSRPPLDCKSQEYSWKVSFQNCTFSHKIFSFIFLITLNFTTKVEFYQSIPPQSSLTISLKMQFSQTSQMTLATF